MKIVIQCARRKDQRAGSLKDANGQPVLFVANPDLAPPAEGCTYARPDDQAPNGRTWRDLLVEYNNEYRRNGANPSWLRPAYRLYAPKIYRDLVDRFCVSNVFILSAGWGLIRADFLTPKYDITFSASAHRYRRRSILDPYNDFRMLPDDDNEAIVFFGGKDYLRLFCNLTREYRSTRFVFFNSSLPPNAPCCILIQYRTHTRTNWHYECAKKFMKGEITCCSEA